MRRIFAFGIVTAWLVSIGLLLDREYFRGGLELEDDRFLTIPPGAVFFSVEIGGAQVGFASSTVDTVPEGIFVQEVVELRLGVGGRVSRVNRRTDAILDRLLNLRHFTTIIQGNEGRARIEAISEGDSLAIEIQTEGNSHSTSMYFSPGTVLSSFLPMKLVFGEGLSRGLSSRVKTLDPLTFRTDSTTVSVFADSTFMIADSAVFDSTTMTWSAIHYDTVHAWKTEFQNVDGVASAWIDDLGRLVSLTTPTGYRITRSVYEVVYENFRRRDTILVAQAGRPVSAVSRRTPGEAGASGSRLSRMTAIIPGAAELDMDGNAQWRHGDTITVTRATLPQEPPFRLGFRSNDLDPFLESDPVVWSDDARIGARARQVVGRTRDPVTAVQRLVDWIPEGLTRTNARRFPDPIATVDLRAGDDNAIVVTFAAMARAVGVPARVVGGFVYIDGIFYNQSWAEVYLGEWIPVDPLAGQFPADASHLRVNTGLNRLLEFARLTGNLQPRIVEATEITG